MEVYIMAKPTLHLMVGLPCSGKTTKAKQLENKHNLIRFTPDEWQLTLFGDDFILDEDNHNIRHQKIEQMMWELAKKLLLKGNDVILDYGFWSKEERLGLFNQSKLLNVSFKIHYMDVELDELLKRLEDRNNNPEYLAFFISKEHLIEWYNIFEPVTLEELEFYDTNS